MDNDSRQAHKDATQMAAQMVKDPAQQTEWLRQLNLIYVALIGTGVVMVQPFLTAPSLDLSATICVVAFAVAIPLLAALVMLNWQETYRRRLASSVLVGIARAVAQGAAVVGVAAGFWHITWIAGVAVLASGLVGMGVHSAGYLRVERDLVTQVTDQREPGSG